MLMVCFLHMISPSNLLDGINTLSFRYISGYSLTIVCYIAVNIFGMLTGYLMAQKKRIKYSRIVSLWFQVFFYSIGISAIFCRLEPELFTVSNIINSIFVVQSGQWWYFSSYFCLFFFIPALNKILEEKSLSKYIIIIGFVLFTCLPMNLTVDSFSVGYGFSPLWLAYVYLIGGYIKIYAPLKRLRAIHYALIWAVCTLLHIIAFISLSFLSAKMRSDNSFGKLIMTYNFPTILIGAVAFFIWMLRVRIPTRLGAFLRVISPLSFAVYIIHEHPAIERILRMEWFYPTMNALPDGVMLLCIVAAVITIFICCICIEFLRTILFKIIKFDMLIAKLDKTDTNKALKK